MLQEQSTRLRAPRRVTLSIASLSVALFTVACGMYTAPPSAAPGTAKQSTVQFKIGDSPADRVLAFEVSVGPISLTPDTGAAVTVLSGTQRVELSHLSATSVPLSLLSIPQGTYKSASIGVANPEVTFLNSAGQVQQIEVPFDQTITIAFSPSLSITASSVVSIDLDIAKALTFDAQGNPTGVNLSAASIALNSAAVTNNNETDDDGELEDVTGTISTVSGTSFTLIVSQTGASLVFSTDNNTEFRDGASLTTNTIVKVDGITRTDGTLYAARVEGIENETGAEAEGLVTIVTGSPATSLTIVTDESTGSGTSNSVGKTLTADVSNAQFVIDDGEIDTSGIGGLPSPPNFPSMQRPCTPVSVSNWRAGNRRTATWRAVAVSASRRYACSSRRWSGQYQGCSRPHPQGRWF